MRDDQGSRPIKFSQLFKPELYRFSGLICKSCIETTHKRFNVLDRRILKWNVSHLVMVAFENGIYDQAALLYSGRISRRSSRGNVQKHFSSDNRVTA